MPSASASPQIESVESRLSEIESTLGEFAQSLDGEKLKSASQSLIVEAQKNHAATTAACEALKAQAEENRAFVSRVGGAVQRIEKRTEERVQKAVEQVAGEASATMTANLDAANERAERIVAATAKVEARQLWSAAAAMLLALLPLALLVAGGWMAIAGLITGAQWALDVDGSVWLGIGRWTWTAACGSASGAGSWSALASPALASPGPATPSSPQPAGWSASWRRGGAAGCRSGHAGGSRPLPAPAKADLAPRSRDTS